MTHNDIVEECPFCDTTQIKSVVNDYGDVIAFEPLNPVVKGHLLVVPKKHVADFTEDIDVTARVMQQAALIAGYLGGEYNLITSKGHNATQSVFHLHVHLVPRHQNDELMLPWTGKDALTQAHTRGYEEGRMQTLHLAEDLFAESADKHELIEKLNDAVFSHLKTVTSDKTEEV